MPTEDEFWTDVLRRAMKMLRTRVADLPPAEDAVKVFVKSDLWPTPDGVHWKAFVVGTDNFAQGDTPNVDAAYEAIRGCVAAWYGAEVDKEYLVQRIVP